MEIDWSVIAEINIDGEDSTPQAPDTTVQTAPVTL